MNFRIDLSHKEVSEHNKEQNYSELLLKDEFTMAREKQGKDDLHSSSHPSSSPPDELYSEFKEAPINFPPTYKFDLRSNGDTYAKHRVPAYTVRAQTSFRYNHTCMRDNLALI